MKTKSFNFLTFWGALVRPNFFQIVQKEKPTKTLWGAWFFWNTLLALLLTGLSFWAMHVFSQELETEFWPQVSEFNFVFEDQKLVSTGLEEPFRFAFQDDAGAEGAFLIDLAGEQYDKSSLPVFDIALLVNQDEIIVYEAEKRRTQTISFQEFPELKNANFTKQDAQNLLAEVKPMILGFLSLFLFGLMWFFFCVLRLIWIAVMAFLFWILGILSRVKGLTYGDCFVATLGLSFLPALIGIGLITTGNFNLLFSIVFYGILFGLNIYDAPKSPAKKS